MPRIGPTLLAATFAVLFVAMSSEIAVSQEFSLNSLFSSKKRGKEH